MFLYFVLKLQFISLQVFRMKKCGINALYTPKIP